MKIFNWFLGKKESVSTKKRYNPAFNDDLFNAIAARNIAQVKALLDKGADPNGKDSLNREIPLVHAVLFELGEEAIKTLISAGADINHPNKNGFPPLVSEASRGKIENVKLLLKYGAAPSALAKDWTGGQGTALGYAAASGHKSIVELLINAGADLKQLHQGEPASYWASLNGHREIAKILTESGVINEKGTKIEEENLVSQKWMTENLSVSTFRNGEPIPEARTDAEWEKAGKEGRAAWCYYGFNPADGEKYGKLYNWYAVKDARGLAPEGWHIPSDDEWQKLIDYLGGDDVAGGKMKETGTEHWGNPNTGATNESGFSALPSGYRDGNGSRGGIGRTTYFWSSTTAGDPNYAASRYLLYDGSDIGRSVRDGRRGSSVRCVRD